MKIMKVLDKKKGNTTYYKYKINLPKKEVDKAKLLNFEVKVKEENGKLIIERDPSKEEFRKLSLRERKLQKEMLKLIGKLKIN